MRESELDRIRRKYSDGSIEQDYLPGFYGMAEDPPGFGDVWGDSPEEPEDGLDEDEVFYPRGQES